MALGSTANFAVVVADTSGNALPADNSTVTAALSAGLAPTGTTTFILGALAAGLGRTFIVSATATALGTQNVTAPDQPIGGGILRQPNVRHPQRPLRRDAGL